jgi:hypothetical protein
MSITVSPRLARIILLAALIIAAGIAAAGYGW